MVYKDYYTGGPVHGKVSLLHNQPLKNKLKSKQLIDWTHHEG